MEQQEKNSRHSIAAVALLVLLYPMSPAYSQARSQTPPTRNAPAAKPGETSANYFAKAKASLDAGNYAAAIRFAAADYKRNPTNRLSLIIMAQSYYRMGNSARAGKLFSALKPEEVPPSAGLEYTLALFASKRYHQATVAWQRVPTNHPYRDIAKFYSGVSYMHLRQYARASQLLRSARKLPANLKSERRRLVDEMDAIVEQSRSNRTGQDRNYTYQAQPRYLPTQPVEVATGAPPQTPGGAAPISPKAPPAPNVGWVFSAVPTFSYETLSEKTDFNGFELWQYDRQTPSVVMPMTLKYSAKPRSFGGQPYLSLSLTPGYDHSEKKTTTSSLTANAESPTTIQSNNGLKEVEEYNQTVIGVIEGMYPVSDPIDVTLRYTSDHKYVSANPAKDIYNTGPLGKITIEGDKIKLTGSVSIIETGDLDNLKGDDPIPAKEKTDTTVQASLARNGESNVIKLDVSSSSIDRYSKSGSNSILSGRLNWDKTVNEFGLGIGSFYTMREIYEGTVITGPSVPRSEQGALASVAWTGPFDIVLTGSLNYTLYDLLEYKTSGDNAVIYAAAGDVKTYKLEASLPLFGAYGGLDLYYQYSDRKVETPGDADEATTNAMLKNFWSQRTTTTVEFTLRYPM